MNAGTIASSSGRLSAAPAPRSMVRLDRARRLLNVITPAPCSDSSKSIHATGFLIRRPRIPHEKRRTADDAENQRGPSKIFRRRGADDLPDRRLIEIAQLT